MFAAYQSQFDQINIMTYDLIRTVRRLGHVV